MKRSKRPTNYVAKIRKPPRTLTADEQTKVLRVSGQKRDDLRDHTIISLALGTGLRGHEIAALDVADVCNTIVGTVKRRISLRVFKGVGLCGRPGSQQVFLTDANVAKLGRYLMVRLGNPGAAKPALFLSREGERIAVRTIRHMWRQWQKAAGFDELHGFHVLRHTAISNVYRRKNDASAAQRFGRHAGMSSTGIYVHTSDEELLEQVRGLRS